MHMLQEKILILVNEKNIGGMTLREIGSHIGEKYPQKIKHHLSQLEKKGLIKIDKSKNSIEKASRGRIRNSPFVSIPIVGAANCGPATIFADENVEGYLKVSSTILGSKKSVFAIKASGPSMNKAVVADKNIEDGDYLVIDPNAVIPQNGDIVLSIIDDTANIKRYYWDTENKQIILVSDSTKDFSPIYIHPDDNFLINGKVIQVIKKPKI
jgi:repressor LexA